MKRYCTVWLLLLGLFLGLHNGYVALWDTQKSQPVCIFPYRASLYPSVDRQALQKGIPVRHRESAIRLLEDFLS